MKLRILRAYLMLIYFDLYLRKRTFASLHDKVRNYPVATTSNLHFPEDAEDICAAVDMACIWYWKQVLCLQRSAATACVLRRYGVRAHMVIGAQQMPFTTHAWVEVDGQILNDHPYVSEIYAVLERC